MTETSGVDSFTNEPWLIFEREAPPEAYAPLLAVIQRRPDILVLLEREWIKQRYFHQATDKPAVLDFLEQEMSKTAPWLMGYIHVLQKDCHPEDAVVMGADFTSPYSPGP